MNNQPSANGGASPELQPMMGLPTNDNSGEGPVADSSTGTSVPAGIAASQSGNPGRIEPESVKTGHD
jgi:hypothetical protein